MIYTIKHGPAGRFCMLILIEEMLTKHANDYVQVTLKVKDLESSVQGAVIRITLLNPLIYIYIYIHTSILYVCGKDKTRFV